MSNEKVEFRKTKRPPSITTHTTVINRTSGGGIAAMTRNSAMSMAMRTGPAAYQPGTAKSISSKGVGLVLESRAKEKTVFQDLNKRLGKLIESSKFLEAQNKALIVELEEERKKKLFDISGIKELYEQELEECRKVISDLEVEKATIVPKIATLEDIVDAEESK